MTALQLVPNNGDRWVLDTILGPPGDGAFATSVGRKPGTADFYPNTSEGRDAFVHTLQGARDRKQNVFISSAIWAESTLDLKDPTLGRETAPFLRSHCLWVDIDSPSQMNWALLNRLKRRAHMITHSGGVDGGRNRLHVRPLLAEPITDGHEFDVLNKWAAHALRGDNKWSQHTWLTMPGTTRYKEDEYPDGRTVSLITCNEDRAWHPDELRALFASYAPEPTVMSHHAGGGDIEAQEGAWDLLPRPCRYAYRNARSIGDDSEGFWRFVCTCAEYGVPEGVALGAAIKGRDEGAFPKRYSDAHLSGQICKAYTKVEAEGKLGSKSTPTQREQKKKGPPDRRTNDQVAPTTSDDALEDIAVDHNTMVDTKFWDSRDYLKRIYEAATNVGRSPWGVLGVVLSRVSCLISPEYVLPPITGSYGSLNVNVLITGKPGSGKNACFSLAKRLVADDIKVCAPASGEAVASVFATRKRTKEGVQTEYHTESAWMTIGEVTQVQAQIQRSGSTLLPTLLSAAMGELIGRDLADRPNGLLIQDHRYRLGVAIGVQPESLELLEKTGGQGLPQRYLWFPGREHGQKRASHEMPPPVATLGVEDSTTDMPDNLDKPRRADEFKIISLPEAVVREVIEFDEDDDKDPLDTHSMLLRLRVAACLMWMDGRKGAISPEDWELSASVMDVSRSTRNRVMGESYAAKQENKIRRLVADSDAVAEAKDRNFKATVEKVRSLVSERLSVGEEVTIRWFQMKVRASRMKDHTDDAVQTLVDKGVLRRSGTSYVRIR
ncbi:hypothetical protein [Nocardia cyriacigeorgica]|uniref:hypothetical protein n=1 Tax=Nocardia cyriacigeorgica TaxID=135487 RepID=UPI00189565BB|nr:hypothetical protein [Nocardia cyriacigeorgica]MBF6090897.1 hypothetical protein [Nocardia cyriacigeorgica]